MLKNKKLCSLNSRGFAHTIALMLVLVGTATVGSYMLVKSHADSVSGTSSTSTGGNGPNYRTVIFGSALGNVLACKSGSAIKFQTSVYINPAKEQFWFDSGTGTITRNWAGGVFNGNVRIPAGATSFNAVVEKRTDKTNFVPGTLLSKFNKC